MLKDSFLNFARGFKETGKCAPAIGSIANATSTLALQGFTVAKAGADLSLNLQLADLAILIANLKADQEEMEAIIRLLKKCIEGLMSEVGSMAEFVQAINTLQTKKYKDADMRQVSFELNR